MSDKLPFFKIAVVGSGPSGFYAAEVLFESGVNLSIDVFERLPVPYGLVRSGVAPDHQKLKQVQEVFSQIATASEFNFVGNVGVGKDVSIDELREHYHAVIIACGAQTDRRIGVPGEDLPGSYTGTEFVGWYNGHTDYQDRQFDLSHETAVIIGQGNVAADVARILAKTIDELKETDITQCALEALAESRVRNIYIVGRRGPAQAKFTAKELRELGRLSNCQPVVSREELELNTSSKLELEQRKNREAKKNYDLFRQFSTGSSIKMPKRCIFSFQRSPIKIVGDHCVEKIVLRKNYLSGAPFEQSARNTGDIESLRVGIVFHCVGYRGLPLPSVPFDEKCGIIPNLKGRVYNDQGILFGLYTTGWIKRGANGVIGTNRADSVETVTAVLEDIRSKAQVEPKSGSAAIYPLLDSRGVRWVCDKEWELINRSEVSRGSLQGKPREKYTAVDQMIDLLD